MNQQGAIQLQQRLLSVEQLGFANGSYPFTDLVLSIAGNLVELFGFFVGFIGRAPASCKILRYVKISITTLNIFAT